MKSFILTLLAMSATVYYTHAQCCNFHASIHRQDNCSVSGDLVQTVYVAGGTAPYTYVWRNPLAGWSLLSGSTNINTSGVFYAACIVTDASGCSDTTMSDWYGNDVSSCAGGPPFFTPSSPLCANFNIAVTQVDGPSTADIVFTGTPVSGTAPYSYYYYGQTPTGTVTFGPTSSSSPIVTSAFGSGNVFIGVTDANGCMARDSFHVEEKCGLPPCVNVSGLCNMDVDGFTSLGGADDNAPSIKMKKISGIIPGGGIFSTPHGLIQSKILSITGMMSFSASVDRPLDNSFGGPQTTATNIMLNGAPGASFRLIITYEQ